MCSSDLYGLTRERVRQIREKAIRKLKQNTKNKLLKAYIMPFMIIPIHTSLTKMDKSLIEAAYDLGANKIQTFWKVIWKLSLPGVVNGIMMVFLLAISSFVIPKLLGGGQYMLIGNLIESQFISVGDWNFGSAISLILAVIILIFMGLMKRMDKQDE